MSDIKKLSVYDGRIVQEQPAFAVDKGALSITNAPFNAIAATSSQMTFNIQAPSLNVFVDRELRVSAGVNCRMQVDVAGVGAAPAAADTPVVVFGKDAALSAFPLHSLMTTATATINDAVSTINTQDVLYELLRFTNQKNNRSQRTTPTMLDKYASYDAAVGAINNPLSSYFDAVDSDNVPNGAFYDIVFTDENGSALSGNGTYQGANAQAISYANGVPILTNDAGTGNAITSYVVYFRFTVTEKLMLSPFIFNEECGDEVGLFGVNNIQLVFNFGQGISRVIRNAPLASTNGRTVSAVQFASQAPFVNPRCNVQFLTPSLDIALPPKSVVPYLEYPRYISTPNQQIAAGGSATLATQTITLPQIPDLLLVYAKPASYAAGTDADYYCPIDQVSVNFDNYAGLLSSHTPEQLYQMAYENGLEMDWNMWSGRARVVNTDAGATPPGSADANNVPLVGGFLVLKPGKDIALQSGMASGVVGNYTLQMNLRVNNYHDAPVTPVIYVVAVNSGFFETQSGSSRLLKGILTEQDVISAPAAAVNTRSQLERVIGGKSRMKMLGTALSKAKAFLKAHPEVAKVGMELGKKALGMGVTGGATTGAAKLNRLM